MFKKIWEKIKAWADKTWHKIKDWSGWSAAGSIFLARLAAIGGAITTFVGTMDFSPFWSLFTSGTDFTPKQLVFMGIGVAGAALTFEITRRKGADL